MLHLSHPDADTWTVDCNARVLVFSYDVSAEPAGFFSDNVRVTGQLVFVNGPGALCYVEGHKEAKSYVLFEAPAGWSTQCALPAAHLPGPHGLNEAGFGPADYDTLADSPIVSGVANRIATRSFNEAGAVFTAVFFDRGDYYQDAARTQAWVLTLRKVVQAEVGIMGTMPTRRYMFLFDVGGGGGGLEHLNCCRLPLIPGVAPDEMAPFVAHEMFHLWNVKRLRPRPLGPFNYVDPPRTRNLWFAEGVTEYYANLAVERAGITGEARFLRQLGRSIQRFGSEVQAEPTGERVSADESSLRVWEAGNSSGYGISYYDAGELIGLCLDLKIRQVSGGARSLDDVMRALYRKYAPPNPGYDEDDLRAAIDGVAGVDLSAFYDRLTRSAEPLPLAECLGYAGLDANAQPLEHATPEEVALRRGWLAANTAHGDPVRP